MKKIILLSLIAVLALALGCRHESAPEISDHEKPDTELPGDDSGSESEPEPEPEPEPDPEPDPEPGEGNGKVVVAYVTSWTSVIPATDRITHINYAFGHVNNSFNGVRIDNESRLRSLVALKASASHLKVVLSIGGWGSGRFSEMAGNESWRKSFAQDCNRVIKEFGLDGIDIDWEYPTSSSAGISSSPQDKDNYTLLMRDIRAAIGENKELTLASASNAGYIDFPSIMQYVDFVNVMAYDMGNAPKHNSALYRSSNGRTSPIAGWVTSDEAVQAHLRAGIPAEKLVLGVPFYGRGDSSYGDYVDYRNINGPKSGHSEVWDDIAQVPYYCDKNGTLVLGFENKRSIAAKCDYANAKGLLGVMYWDYSGDNNAGDLSKEIADKILKR